MYTTSVHFEFKAKLSFAVSGRNALFQKKKLTIS